MPWLEAIVIGKMDTALLEAGHPIWLIWKHIWIKESWQSLTKSWPFWLESMEAVGQNSIFISGLVIVYSVFHCQTLLSFMFNTFVSIYYGPGSVLDTNRRQWQPTQGKNRKKTKIPALEKLHPTWAKLTAVLNWATNMVTLRKFTLRNRVEGTRILGENNSRKNEQ